MKRFKIIFFTFVALLAMSFTIIPWKSTPKSVIDSLRLNDCYTRVTPYSGAPLPACMTPLAIELITDVTSCTVAQAQVLKIAGEFLQAPIDPQDCPPTSTSVFCCARKQIVTCGTVTKERIKEIYCKTSSP